LPSHRGAPVSLPERGLSRVAGGARRRQGHPELLFRLGRAVPARAGQPSDGLSRAAREPEREDCRCGGGREMTELAGLVLEASWRIVPPALAAALVLRLARRPSPRAAHTVWAVTLAGMLLLPLLVAMGPRWPLDVPISVPALPFAAPDFPT